MCSGPYGQRPGHQPHPKASENLSIAGLQSHTQAAGGTPSFLTFQPHLAEASALEKKDLQGSNAQASATGSPLALGSIPGEGEGGAVQRVFPEGIFEQPPRRPLVPLISITGVGCRMAGCTHAAMSSAKTFLQIFLWVLRRNNLEFGES